MKVIELEKGVLIKEPTSLALGFFDGIHIGHRRLLEKARDIAQQKGYKSGILTFKRHPLEVLKPGFSFHYLTTMEEKMKIVESIGLDYFILMPFTKETADTSPEDFINKTLIENLNIKAAVVGNDYRFGKKAAGNTELLRQMLKPAGAEVHLVDFIQLDNDKVGSTQIRSDILKGSFFSANKHLGRWYSLEGEVITGEKRGRKLGVPTANLALPKDKIVPPEGVYCVYVLYNNKLYQGAGSIGSRPTFGQTSPSIEIHLLNFNSVIYGERIRVFFIKKVRDILKFDIVEDLTTQIKKDVEFCCGVFSEIPQKEKEDNFRCCPEAVMVSGYE